MSGKARLMTSQTRRFRDSDCGQRPTFVIRQERVAVCKHTANAQQMCGRCISVALALRRTIIDVDLPRGSTRRLLLSIVVIFRLSVAISSLACRFALCDVRRITLTYTGVLSDSAKTILETSPWILRKLFQKSGRKLIASAVNMSGRSSHD